ncbi:MAG: CPBP family intramembrane metalloprotease [Erysipelotrichaceae bacterium]|nr:CPBP family intramembrane metalloprotease [Erysipelotrichaceae bacterium]
MLKKIVGYLKKHPIAAAALTVIFGTVCVYTVPVENNFHRFLVRAMLCGFVSFVLYQISGEKTFESSYKNTGYVIKCFSALLIISLIQGVLLLLGNIQSNTMVDNPIIGLVNTFIFYISVGLFEELLFRAVINDAILYELRDKKNVFIIIALVSSVAFGAIHTIDVDVTSITAWALAIGKTSETAVFGFALLILYWKTRNVWACGIVHGLYDFLTAFSTGIFQSAEEITSYVAVSDNSSYSLIMYGIRTVIGLIIVFIIWKKIGKKIDFEKMRKEW